MGFRDRGADKGSCEDSCTGFLVLDVFVYMLVVIQASVACRMVLGFAELLCFGSLGLRILSFKSGGLLVVLDFECLDRTGNPEGNLRQG